LNDVKWKDWLNKVNVYSIESGSCEIACVFFGQWRTSSNISSSKIERLRMMDHL
jgi:hypothetical protein